MDRQEVKTLVARMIGGFPSLLERSMVATVLSWEHSLGHLDFQVASKALDKVMLVTKFPPTIAEISEAAREFMTIDKTPTTEEAWGEVLRKIDPWKTPEWSHEYVKKAVQRIGYSNLCRSENIGVERAHFFRIYDSIIAQAKNNQINGEVNLLAEKLSERFTLNTDEIKELN